MVISFLGAVLYWRKTALLNVRPSLGSGELGVGD